MSKSVANLGSVNFTVYVGPQQTTRVQVTYPCGDDSFSAENFLEAIAEVEAAVQDEVAKRNRAS